MSSQFTITDASELDSNIFVQEVISPSQQVMYAFANGVTNVCIFLTPESGNLPRNKPQSLKTELDSKLGPNAPIRIRFTRTGKLLIETSDAECAQAAAEITQISNIPVSAYIQQESITSRFVVHNVDKNTRLVELGREIQSENNLKVKELRRFTRRENEIVHETETVLVTIFGTTLPKEIKMFYMLERIRPFYDRPRQCSNCWRFDHATGKCRNETVCRKCGDNHNAAKCNSEHPLCTNCKESHIASDLNCPARTQEMNFLKYKTDHHLPITEARRRFAKKPQTQSYVEAIKTNLASDSPAKSEFVTKVDFEKAMDNFFQRTQASIVDAIQQLTSLLCVTRSDLDKSIEKLTQTVEGLVGAFSPAHASVSQVSQAITHPPLKTKTPSLLPIKPRKSKTANNEDPSSDSLSQVSQAKNHPSSKVKISSLHPNTPKKPKTANNEDPSSDSVTQNHTAMEVNVQFPPLNPDAHHECHVSMDDV